MYPYIIVFFLLLSSDYISKKYVNFICFFILLIFMGMRFYIGVDFAWYYGLAMRTDLSSISIFSSLKDFFSYIKIESNLYNFYLYKYLALEIFNKILYKIVWILKKPQLIIFIYSFLVLFFLKISIKKIDKKYIKYIWIFFFCFSEFFLLECNMIRQGVAVSIVFYSYKYMQKKKIVQFLICILFACGFHSSAIFTLPLYLFNYIKKIDKKILIVIYILSFFGKETVLGIMRLGWIPEKYIGYILKSVPIGMKIYYIILLLGVLLIIFIDKIDKKKYSLVLIVLFGCCLNLLFKGTGYLAMRTRIYYLIFILYLIPDCLEIIKKYFKTKYIYIFICFILLILNLLNDKYGIKQYVPYKTFINKNVN